MKIEVTVKTASRKEEVFDLGERRFKVCVKAPAADGKANRALIQALAAHFGVPKSRVSILRGQTSKIKLLEIA